MKRTIVTFAALAVALALSGCTEKDPFAIADTDGNSTLSPGEFERFMLEAIYTESDSDGDKKVTMAEYAAANPSGKKFKTIDADGDGGITPAEAKAFATDQGTFDELFAKIDADGSKTLTRAEAEAFHSTVTATEGSTKLEKLSNATSQ